jgi:hypothetical protein
MARIRKRPAGWVDGRRPVSLLAIIDTLSFQID